MYPVSSEYSEVHQPIRVHGRHHTPFAQSSFVLGIDLALMKQRLDALEHLRLVDAATTTGAGALRYILKDDSLSAHIHPHLYGAVFVYASARTLAILDR